MQKKFADCQISLNLDKAYDLATRMIKSIFNINSLTRTNTCVTYTLSYDAENRLIGVSGINLSTVFTHDADGKRVQQVLNNVATKFIGNHYEVEGTTASKYYLAGTAIITKLSVAAPETFR